MNPIRNDPESKKQECMLLNAYTHCDMTESSCAWKLWQKVKSNKKFRQQIPKF